MIWEASGKWHLRGNKRGEYCMCRPGDKGAYEIGNVKIVLNEENRAERNRNYPLTGERSPRFGRNAWAERSPEQKAKFSAAQSALMKGKPKSLEQREKMKIANRETARIRRFVMRDGKRAWAFPGDADYPVCNA